jgi:hypothetical protein
MKDLEKQVTEDDSKDALPPVQVMAGGEEQDPLILVAQDYHLRKKHSHPLSLPPSPI